jgi:hypothetical protein
MPRLLVLMALLACGQALDSTPPAARADAPRLVVDRTAYYPRLIRLAHGPERGTLLLSVDHDRTAAGLYQSTDEGHTWARRAALADTTRPGHCCSGLWEVPQPLGDTPAGTLFWTTSVGQPRDPRSATALNLFRSTDAGKTWTLASTPVRGTVGLWEAEYLVDAHGRLVLFYSTEEHRNEGFNQLLAHKVSTDGGRTWGPEVRDVAMPDRPDRQMRPGMATVRRLPNGRYVMVYEICGMGCDVFIRFSDDGTHWGDPADPGTRIESGAGHHFAHAPTVTVLPDGRLAVIGQLLFDNQNRPAPGNGRVYFVGTGRGTWTEHPAPVPVPEAVNDPCPNYSSQLLPLPDGTLLGAALRPGPAGCRLYVGRGPGPR